MDAINLRLVVIALLAGGILWAFIAATGDGFPSPPSSPSAGSTPAIAIPTLAPAGQVKGAVTVQAHRLAGTTWQFVYRVRNVGKTPIAGFQINAPPSNLYAIRDRSDWTFFGSGVCHGQPPGMLIYWSTPLLGSPIPPGQSDVFSFKVNTSGVETAGYAVSWGTAKPEFATTRGPKPSTLPARGPCK